MIRYLKHSDIDRPAWDHCVRNARFETMYPYSWYLDLVAPKWDGLVWGSYEGVMPLTWTRKFGLKLLLQPILAQQLGFFSTQDITASLLDQCLAAIPAKFRYADICLNRSNPLPEPARYRTLERHNYELDLRQPEDAYHTNTRRNLQKGLAHDFRLSPVSVETYLNLRFSTPGSIHARRTYLHGLFTSLTGSGRAECVGLFLEGRLQAAAVLGWSESRVIYLNGCSAADGKDNRAMFVLMDRLIQNSRKKAGIFDFEGSNLPGVARFFEGFGARRTTYPRIILRRFPVLAKIS